MKPLAATSAAILMALVAVAAFAKPAKATSLEDMVNSQGGLLFIVGVLAGHQGTVEALNLEPHICLTDAATPANIQAAVRRELPKISKNTGNLKYGEAVRALAALQAAYPCKGATSRKSEGGSSVPVPAPSRKPYSVARGECEMKAEETVPRGRSLIDRLNRGERVQSYVQSCMAAEGY